MSDIKRIGVLTGGGDAPGPERRHPRRRQVGRATAGIEVHRPRGQLRRPHRAGPVADADAARRHRHPAARRHHPRHDQPRQPVRVPDQRRSEGTHGLLGPRSSRCSTRWGSTRWSSSAATARSPSPSSSASAAFPSSACRRPSTTTSSARRTASASTPPSPSRPMRSTACTRRPKRTAASWWSR